MEIKDIVEGIARDFESFKKDNDQRLKQLESKKHVDPLLEDKVNKTNDGISRLEADLKAVQTAMARSAQTVVEVPASEQGKLSKEAFTKFITKGERALTAEEVKTLSTVDDSQGGYLVPHEMEQSIIRSLATVNAVRGLANVVTISKGNDLSQPRRTAGVSATRSGEMSSNPSATNPTFGMLKITAEEMRYLGKITANMLEDAAYNVEGFLQDEAVEAFANAEGLDFVSGSGVGRAMGMLSYASGTGDGQVEQVVSGTAATIADADGQANGLITLQHTLKAAYAKQGKWLINCLTVGSVRKLKDSQKGYIWSPGLGGNPPTILGAEYVEDDNMPVEAANALVAIFGDFKKFYKIVDKVGLAVTRDPFTSKPMIEFLFRRRVGGAVEIFEAAKILKCSV